MTAPSYGPENPRAWDSSHPSLTAIETNPRSVPHELGGVLRAAKGRKGAALAELLRKTPQQVVAESLPLQEQEREALAAGREVYSKGVSGWVK